MRNKIDDCLVKCIGEKWYYNSELSLTYEQKEMMPTTTFEKRGQLISSLSFGFWTRFFRREFEELWRQNLRFLFKRDSPLTRSEIAFQLDRLRQLRNRIAHHECILKMNISALEKSSFEIIGLLSPHALSWLKLDLLGEEDK